MRKNVYYTIDVRSLPLPTLSLSLSRTLRRSESQSVIHRCQYDAASQQLERHRTADRRRRMRIGAGRQPAQIQTDRFARQRQFGRLGRLHPRTRQILDANVQQLRRVRVNVDLRLQLLVSVHGRHEARRHQQPLLLLVLVGQLVALLIVRHDRIAVGILVRRTEVGIVQRGGVMELGGADHRAADGFDGAAHVDVARASAQIEHPGQPTVAGELVVWRRSVAVLGKLILL